MSRHPSLPYPAVKLKQGRDQSVRRGHPWVFSGAVGSVEPEGREDGSPVSILTSAGEPLGVGHYFNNSIAVKVVSRHLEKLDEKFWRTRIEDAIRLRQEFGLGSSPETDAYRLVNGEGDYCPGLIVDRYGESIAVQLQTEGTIRAGGEIAAAVEAAAGLLGIKPKIVVRRKGEAGEKGEEEEQSGREESGEGAAEDRGRSDSARIRENGLQYEVDLLTGQKTGFFLDQRENRRILGTVSRAKRVLNLFCYSGAFSVSAFAGGAAEVVSVDSSKGAMALCQTNVEHNGFSERHTAVCEDCFSFLESRRGQFDLAVVDPPAFVKHAKALRRGLTGYEAINALAFRAVRPGGMMLTFSCSQLVSREEFYNCISRAAVKAGRAVQIVQQLSAAACHPVALAHPEGEYLKGYLLKVG